MAYSVASVPGSPCLSVVMPCYNEAATIDEVVEQVLESPYTAELIIVDDGSTDGTREILAGLDDPRVPGAAPAREPGQGRRPAPRLQRGDGAVRHRAGRRPRVRPAASTATCSRPLLDGKADVVYGSRFLGGRPHRVLYFWHSVGNRLLTTASNMFTNLNLTDMETCYKAFRREVHPEHRRSRRTGSASSPRSRPRSRGRAGGSTRSASPTRAHLRRGQEDRLARRRPGLLLHRRLLAVGERVGAKRLGPLVARATARRS